MAKKKDEGNGTLTEEKPVGLSVLEKLLTVKNSPVDLKEIAYQFHQQVGGAKGFVKMVMDEFKKTKVGSLARGRIMQLMTKLFEIGTPKERVGETALLSDQDLIDAYYGQLARSGVKVVKDEPPAEPKPKKEKLVYPDHFCI